LLLASRKTNTQRNSYPFSTSAQHAACPFLTYFQPIWHKLKNEQPLIFQPTSLLICCHLDVKKNRQNKTEQQNLTKASELWIYDTCAQNQRSICSPSLSRESTTERRFFPPAFIQNHYTTSGQTPRGDVIHRLALQSPLFP
jgi:hypothetical protein